ncbi:acyltransferase family protein [Mycetocola sp. 2940]|uniref:acyltransferase family protein n=1 Tax=Mycetocola sp. 2940 TaxID=3156452 RepID=UPI003394B235
MTTTTTQRATQTQQARTDATQRADIQGLRAVAVLAVVVFHLWPAVLPGGYIGVDVFFVLSGFLITTHLVREVDRTGSVSLAVFWARRARRLLPASLTVLLVTAGGIWLLAPAGVVGRFLGEVMASVGYVQNLALAARSVDYLAAESAPSPVQHFWSLAAEEQFYLVWPVLILAAVVLGRKGSATGSGSPRRNIALVLAMVVAASFTWSVIFTARDPSPAYFLPTTRAWEFGAGGLLAIAAPALARLAGRTRVPLAALAWAGLAAIGAAAVAYGPSTPFPGSAAVLPVLGTLAVIAAAEPGGRFAPTRILAVRPVQRLGDLSYGVYLWHWPLIVLTPMAFGRGMTVVDGLVVAAASVALAAATERWVENPIRYGVLATRRPRATFAAMAAAMAVVLLVPLSTLGVANDRLATEQRTLEALVDENPACLGAAAVNSDECARVEPVAAVIPDPSLADASPERCIAGIRSADLTVCYYGAPADRAPRTVALVGDSHAEQWLPAFADLATDRGWALVVIAKSSCPFGPDRRFEEHMSAEALTEMNERCADWNDQALRWLNEHSEVDALFTATRARNSVVAEPFDADWQTSAAREYRLRWAELPPTIEHVVVLRDTPRMNDDYLACLAESGDDAVETCAVHVSDAIERDPAAEAVNGSDDPKLGVIDLTPYFCPDGLCRPVIGGVLAYRDSHHISWVYASTLVPFLGAEIDALMG